MISTEFVAQAALIAHVVIGFVATVLILANRRPPAAVAWLLAILLEHYEGSFERPGPAEPQDCATNFFTMCRLFFLYCCCTRPGSASIRCGAGYSACLANCEM